MKTNQLSDNLLRRVIGGILLLLALAACEPPAPTTPTTPTTPVTLASPIQPAATPTALLPVSTLTPDTPPLPSATPTLDAPVISLPGQGKTITMARATWETGWFQAEIVGLLLEELGYTVEGPIVMENDEFYMAAARGEVDLWANGWFPSHATYLEHPEVKDKVGLVGYEVRAGALQGYAVDKKTAGELGITNLGDFQDSTIAQHFDRNGNGKADLIGCNTGWGCYHIINHHLATYALTDTVEHVVGNYTQIISETMGLYEQGESVLFYTWTPSWMVDRMVPGKDFIWIEVPYPSLPPSQSEMEDLGIVWGVKGCVNDPCTMGFPPNDIRVVANIEFLQENPAASRLLEMIEIPFEDISAQNTRMRHGEDSEEQVREHAKNWIFRHREIINQWLSRARSVE
jgi:glycine betaine/proline transport system substrate-binding protein